MRTNYMLFIFTVLLILGIAHQASANNDSQTMLVIAQKEAVSMVLNVRPDTHSIPQSDCAAVDINSTSVKLCFKESTLLTLRKASGGEEAMYFIDHNPGRTQHLMVYRCNKESKSPVVPCSGDVVNTDEGDLLRRKINMDQVKRVSLNDELKKLTPDRQARATEIPQISEKEYKAPGVMIETAWYVFHILGGQFNF